LGILAVEALIDGLPLALFSDSMASATTDLLIRLFY
jgi:hypothetical protein